MGIVWRNCMKLFFYSSSNAVRDMLSLNMIGSYALSQKERAKTIGFLANTSLFLTHKKLNSEKMNYGLDSDLAFGESAVVIELTITDDISKEIPVILVNSIGKDFAPKAGCLNEYDEQTTIGAFWKGFIPMSFVTGIYFENRESMLDFYRPSPDLWYPECLYKIINTEEFKEDLDVSKIVPYDGEEDLKAVTQAATKYIKCRAILYYAINATSKWKYGKHILNIDPVLVDMLQIDTSVVKDLAGEEFHSIVLQAPDDVLSFSKEDGLYKLCIAMLEELMKATVSTVMDEAYFDDFSESLYKKLADEQLSEKFISDCKKAAIVIKEGVLSNNDEYEKSFDKLRYASPYAALALVLKNPHYEDNFLASLDAYDVPQDIARIAQIYFAAINGLNFLCGDYKNNLYINRRVEEIALSKLDDVNIPKVVYSEEKYISLFEEKYISSMKKFEISYKMAITSEEIRLFLLTEEGRKLIKLSTIQKAYGKKKICDWNRYKYFEVCHEIKKGDRISVEVMDKFIKSAKYSNFYKYDIDLFCTEMIENKDSFKKLYDTKPDIWMDIYKNRKR